MSKESAQSINQLMAAPLQALVEAESNAAFATAKFIKEVGFISASDEPEEFGDLRMVTFSHERYDSSGNRRLFKIKVPLLSLIPIPALQIKDSDLEFYVRIVDNPQVTKVKEEIKKKKDISYLFGDEPPRQLKGTLGREQSTTSRQSSMDMQIKVRIRMEQADMPVGLSQLFNMMAENVSEIDQTDQEEEKE